MKLSSYSDCSSSRFNDLYKLLPTKLDEPNLQIYKRVGRQANLSLEVMKRQAMLKQFKMKADYIFYQSIHELVDRGGTMKSKFFDKKEAVLLLLSSFYQQLVKSIEFLEFNDRTFLKKALTALDKWLEVSNKVFKKESIIDVFRGPR